MLSCHKCSIDVILAPSVRLSDQTSSSTCVSWVKLHVYEGIKVCSTHSPSLALIPFPDSPLAFHLGSEKVHNFIYKSWSFFIFHLAYLVTITTQVNAFSCILSGVSLFLLKEDNWQHLYDDSYFLLIVWQPENSCVCLYIAPLICRCRSKSHMFHKQSLVKAKSSKVTVTEIKQIVLSSCCKSQSNQLIGMSN